MDLKTAEPNFSVHINGIDLSHPIKDRIVSLRTTDAAGILSDSCEIELDDFDEAIQMPKTEAKVEVSLGYKETELTKIGSYFVKEIEIDGARKVIKISANAASKKMRSQATKSHEGTLADFIQNMAANLDLESAFSEEFEDMDLSDFPQFAESDMSYLTTLSQKVGAIAKPSNGHLIFANNLEGKSASGKNLPTKYVDISEVSSYSCSFKETEESGSIGTVIAYWYDKEKADYCKALAGSGDPITELDEIFSSVKDAQSAANAKIKRIVKANKQFQFTTFGRPDFFAEHPIVLQGFSSKIPTNWIISKVEHSLNSSGFITNVTCTISQ